MEIVKPYIKVPNIDGVQMMRNLEKAGRTCYKSHVTSDDSYKNFISNIIKRGHESVLEHEKITVRYVTDRGALWDITRHRLASFSVESSRWCNYSKDKFGKSIKFMEPFYLMDDEEKFNKWKEVMQKAEDTYFELADKGCPPDVCRMLLPASLATEIVMTCNLREWRHIFKMRATNNVHPTIRQFIIPLLLHLKEKMPEMFSDIEYDTEFDPKNYSELIVTDEL